ncbi:uncharacterized protein METZ01_LOCUS37727, partial [marine metagenome]
VPVGVKAKSLLSHVDMRELGTARLQGTRVDILEEYGQLEGRELRMIFSRSCLRGVEQ